MRPDDVNVLAVLKQALGYHSERQRVITENVANANTPGYVPREVSRSDFERAVEQVRGNAPGARLSVTPVQVSATHSGHIAGTPATSRQFRTERAPDSETTINGNSVVLEEQMVRAQETRMQYESAMTLYQKSLGLIRMAIKPPAR